LTTDAKVKASSQIDTLFTDSMSIHQGVATDDRDVDEKHSCPHFKGFSDETTSRLGRKE